MKVDASLSKSKANVKGLEFSFLKHPPATEFVPESRCGDLLKTASPLPLLRLGSWWFHYFILLGEASPFFLFFLVFFYSAFLSFSLFFPISLLTEIQYPYSRGEWWAVPILGTALESIFFLGSHLRALGSSNPLTIHSHPIVTHRLIGHNHP